MRYLSWKEFDFSVDFISKLCYDKTFSGVYGLPRGGLCLAVALSHSLQIPLQEHPQPNSLIIDDIYETGKTLNKFRYIEDITVIVWISKIKPEWWKTVEIVDSDEWIVFPWENYLFASKDEENYRRSRLSAK
tara:strand:- start:1542 stop:1937 length:396 start_codon:yes stop_codon:yes gene_type:complete